LAFDLWVPFVMQPQLEGVSESMLSDRQTRNLIVTARLKPEVTLAQARAEIQELARYMAKTDADTNTGISAHRSAALEVALRLSRLKGLGEVL
jgi:hypothetical protein